MITQILERLFLEGLQDAERLSRNNPIQIATVISLSEQCVEHKAEDVRYIHLPMEDAEPVPMRQFEMVMKAIAEGIRTGKELVHCAVGFSRSPTLTAAYLHRVGYLNFNSAIEEIRQLRPTIDPSKILVSSVKEHL
jgi:protein-tyrosine phosphatase